MYVEFRGVCLTNAVMSATNSLLSDLPSRGLLQQIQIGAGFSGRPVSYIAAHDTRPPVGQVVTTDQSSLLIRCLQSKKRAGNSSIDEQRRGTSVSTIRTAKRKAGSHEEELNEHKRKVTDGPGGSVTGNSVQTIYSREALSHMTVKELQEILLGKNEPTSGKKVDLIRRILDRQ